MGVVPSGQFSLHEGADRLELTIAGVLFGQYRSAFDRRLGLFERDGRAVCMLDQISGVEVQATGLGRDASYTFMLVVAHTGGVEHLYLNENKEAVAELAAKIAAFVGVRVTHREQPFQRQVRETIGGVLPSAALYLRNPTRFPRPIAGAISLWRALSQALVGLMLVFMGGLVLVLASSRNDLLAVGAVMCILGLALFAFAVYSATRTVRSGAFDPAAAVMSADDAEDTARFAPAGGRLQGSMGLFSMIGRTSLVFGLFFFAIGVGVMALAATTQGSGSAAGGILIGLVFAGVGGFLVWQAVTKIGVWRAIQASPLTIEAVVHEIHQVNRRPRRFAIEYRYRDASGISHVAESFPLTPDEADLWRRLDVAAIIVNRHRPEQSMLADLRPVRHSTREERYPDGDVRAASRWPSADTAAE